MGYLWNAFLIYSLNVSGALFLLSLYIDVGRG